MMTGQEAWDLVAREAAEAKVEFGPAGRDPRFKALVIKAMDEQPEAIPQFIKTSRRNIEMKRAVKE